MIKGNKKVFKGSEEYLLVLPNVFYRQPLQIGNVHLRAFVSEDETEGDDENKDLLSNIQQMLINNGYSGIFTYSFVVAENQFQNLVLNIRKIMTLLRYITFIKDQRLSLECLTYYILKPHKFSHTEQSEMKYSLEGLQDGNLHIHFWAPGFEEVKKRVTYPEILQIDNENLLIRKFTAGDIEEKYIIAIERFNRTFKDSYDPVEDILNLTTAFEHIFHLKGQDKAELLSEKLIETFGLKCHPLAKTFKNWCIEFYKIRGQISHGNAFKHYKEERGYNYWEECFKWKHPDGIIRYINHSTIAKKILNLLIERFVEQDRENGVALEETSQERSEFLEKLEQEIIVLDIEPLVTPNEIYYRKLKELLDSNTPFGLSYYDYITRIKQYDGTEVKSVVMELLKYFIKIIKKRFSDLEKECVEIKNLMLEEGETSLIALKAIKLSQKIRLRESTTKVISDESLYNFYLAQFLEKAYYTLTQIAWDEKLKGR
jgi:hypothetical protein